MPKSSAVPAHFPLPTRGFLALVATVLTFACGAAPGAQARAATGAWSGDFAIPAFDGPTYTCAIFLGNYVVGGEFEWAGEVRTSNVAMWTGAQWAPLGGGVSGRIYKLAVHPSGLYAATGSFGPASGPVMSFDGLSWHRVGNGLFGTAEALYLDGPDLYVAGQLGTVGVEIAYRVMRWSGLEWQPIGGPFDGQVLTMRRFGGDLYAGGWFTGNDGSPVHQIARWDGTAWREAGNPTGEQNGVSVTALVEYQNRLVAGGSFATIGGVAANGIAAWDGSEWSALPGTPSTNLVQGLEVEGSVLHVVGVMQEPSVWAAGLATFDGTQWTLPEWYPSWGVADVATADGRLIAVGFHSELTHGAPATDWLPTRDVVVREGTWHDLVPWRSSMRGLLGPSYTSVLSMQEFHGDIVAGGYFRYAAQPPNWIETGGLARWDGSAWRPLGEVVQGYGYAMAQVGDRLVVGGFGFGTTTASSSVIAWDGSAWSAPGGRLEGTVTALEDWNGSIVAGGALFLNPLAGVAIDRGDHWEALGSGLAAPDVLVQDLAIWRGELYVVGTGLQIPGAGPRGIARWDGTRWAEFRSAPFTRASCLLAVDDQALYVGTSDYSLDHSVWKWDGSTWAAVGSLTGNVRRLLAADEDIYACGTLHGGFYTSLARWDGTAWEPIEDAPNGSIEAMAARGRDLYIGGWFTRAGGRQAEGFARWSGVRVPDLPPTVRRPMLAAPWPSPAREQVSFRITLERPGRVELTLHDLRGAVVARPLTETLPAGTFERTWSLRGGREKIPAGVYFARLAGPDGSSRTKVVVAP